jgi:hypothetical protein
MTFTFESTLFDGTPVQVEGTGTMSFKGDTVTAQVLGAYTEHGQMVLLSEQDLGMLEDELIELIMSQDSVGTLQ